MSHCDRSARPALVAGCDYPDTYRDFIEMFPDDSACVGYLEALRWPTGFTCNKCGARAEPWRLLEQAVVTEPITEAAVTHGYEW